jgi:hypothetical protein
MGIIMSEAEIIRTLEAHGIACMYNRSGLWMLDTWVQEGEVRENWIPVIRDRIKLYNWLGYGYSYEKTDDKDFSVHVDPSEYPAVDKD